MRYVYNELALRVFLSKLATVIACFSLFTLLVIEGELEFLELLLLGLELFFLGFNLTLNVYIIGNMLKKGLLF